MKLRSMEELTDGVIGLVYVYDQHGRRYVPCFKNNTKLHTAADETLDPEKCLGWVPYMPQSISDKIPTSLEARQVRQRAGKWIVGISAVLSICAGLAVTLNSGYGWLQAIAFVWVQLIAISGVMIGVCFSGWRKND